VNKLTFDLANLRRELESSHNSAATYIQSLLLVLLDGNSSVDAIDSILRQIKSSSKIIDFANFTHRQELMWIEIWRDASSLLDRSRHNRNQF
jgi:hypothetical protein